MIEIVEILKENKLKLTPQRIAIYEYLVNSKAHPTVETIYRDLSVEHPSLSLATVYKTLGSFKSKGIVRELNIGENGLRYDGDYSPHAHFLCRKCDKLYDLPAVNSFDEYKSCIKSEFGHILESEQVYFYGVCAECEEN